MRIMILLLCSAVFFPAVSFAQSSAPAAPRKELRQLIEKYEGKITKIAPRSGQAENLGEFSILENGGKAKDFKLIPKTSFFEGDSKPITFKDLKKGDKVTVLSVVTLKGENNVITVTRNK